MAEVQTYNPSGLTPETFKNVQLGAGAFFFNLDMEDIEVDEDGYAIGMTAHEFGTTILDPALAEGKSLGATNGGGTFNVVPEMEQIPVDGMTYPVLGSTVLYSYDISLSTTIKEVVARNIKRVLATMTVLSDGITVSSSLTADHYIPSIHWVGRFISGELACITLTMAMNTEGMVMTMPDRGGAEIPVTFRGHQADLTTMQYAPFRIILFKVSEDQD